MKVTREIIIEEDELFCSRDFPEFRQLEDTPGRDTRFDNGIRVYGSHHCANIQIRSVSPLTNGGKPRRLIATASFLDANEVKALIDKLQEILPTLYTGKLKQPNAKF